MTASGESRRRKKPEGGGGSRSQLIRGEAPGNPFWPGGFSACGLVLSLRPNGHLSLSCSSQSSCSSSGTLAGSPLATTSTNHSNHSPSSSSTPRRTATRSSPSPEGASPLFLILVMALGGLGAILLSGHPSLSPSHVLSKVDLRSVFLAVVFVIIVLVLGAYPLCVLP